MGYTRSKRGEGQRSRRKMKENKEGSIEGIEETNGGVQEDSEGGIVVRNRKRRRKEEAIEIIEITLNPPCIKVKENFHMSTCLDHWKYFLPVINDDLARELVMKHLIALNEQISQVSKPFAWKGSCEIIRILGGEGGFDGEQPFL